MIHDGGNFQTFPSHFPLVAPEKLFFYCLLSLTSLRHNALAISEATSWDCKLLLKSGKFKLDLSRKQSFSRPRDGLRYKETRKYRWRQRNPKKPKAFLFVLFWAFLSHLSRWLISIRVVITLPKTWTFDICFSRLKYFFICFESFFFWHSLRALHRIRCWF